MQPLATWRSPLPRQSMMPIAGALRARIQAEHAAVARDQPDRRRDGAAAPLRGRKVRQDLAGVSRHGCISSSALAVAGHTLNDSRKTPATQHGNRDPRTARDRRTARRRARGTGSSRRRAGRAGGRGSRPPDRGRADAGRRSGAGARCCIGCVWRAARAMTAQVDARLGGRQHAGRDRTRAPRRAAPAGRLVRGPGPERAAGRDRCARCCWPWPPIRAWWSRVWPSSWCELRHARDCRRRSGSGWRLETREILAPLANRLGVWSLKWELEDLAFRYLEPEDYHRIARALAERRVDRERYIERGLRTAAARTARRPA